jgi:hypothetical protein
MQEVVETDVLKMLEENYQAAKEEIRELDHQAWSAMKTLDDKTKSSNFDVERYHQLKKRLRNRLPELQSKVLKERIRVLQQRRPEIQRELDAIQPAQLKTKALVIQAQKILDDAWQEHAKLDLKAAALEGELGINFENLRDAQRELQGVISEIIDADLDHDNGLSANEENLLIRN